ncbi:MAG: nucleotidyl transferase AbiEii/AbiGii toxin family protein [Verrucomicrobiota bacterium]
MPEPDSVLAPRVVELLERIGAVLNRFGLLLVGGTALAIHLNHRRSIDLDFFGRTSFDPDEMLSDLESELGSQHLIEVVGKDQNTLSLLIDGIKVDILRHPYPQVGTSRTWKGVEISSHEDLAAMKLNAITNRGAKKDFFDLFFLLEQFPLSLLLQWYGEKYANRDPFFVIQSLSYFDDAEQEPDPDLGKEISWSEVKEKLEKAVRGLGRE